jgi:hypothetical protein|tara:strand:- start:2421 stop:2624 length:204 start_codon:yes stop_codon:yes gene_type:complete
MSNKNIEFKSLALCLVALVLGVFAAQLLDTKTEVKFQQIDKVSVPVEEYHMHDLIHPTTNYDLDKVA